MNRKLNLLFLASWYPSRVHPSLGNFIGRHARAVATNHNVCVVTAVEAGFNDVEIKEDDSLMEIIVYFRKSLPLLSFQKAMKKGVSESELYFGKSDLVHVHVAFPAGLTALNLGLPYVVTEHFSGYHPVSGYKWSGLQKSITKRILKKAQLVLPVSDFLKNAIREFSGAEKFEVVPNVVNEDLFYPDEFQSEVFTFLHISTLEERSKNITGLLAGVKKLHEMGEEFLLKIGGDGDLEELNRKIKKAGIPFEKIEIINELPIEGVAGAMRESNSLLMYSHFETQSCTVLESLCSGRPVVSSAVGGIPEIVNESNGILVEPNNPDALASGMQEMIRNYSKFNSEKISKDAKARYSYKAVADQLDKIYTTVLKKGA